MGTQTLHTERDWIATRIRAIKAGAAEFSQLLAADVLSGDDWERVVLVLARCRDERKRLDDRLRQIDATLALMLRARARDECRGEKFYLVGGQRGYLRWPA